MARFKINVVIWYILLLGWMGFIFIMSAQTSQESSNVSGGIVSKLIAVFYNKFDLLSDEKQAEITGIFTVIVRKSAHFLEYFVLGVFSLLSAVSYNKYSYKIKGIYAVVVCVLYSISDEIHQFFVPGRACRFMDICIDSAGSITAILLLSFLFYKKRKKSGETNAKKEIN
ncbi:MAG: VanZ family protein [Clostridia bacterium]|nr:VanZ family protein [Clostridia bacterium]